MKERIFGRISKWFPSKGFGFVNVSGRGRVFVHRTSLRMEPSRGDDLTGEKVLLEEVEWTNSKGPKAVVAYWGSILRYKLESEEENLWKERRDELERQVSLGEVVSLRTLIEFCTNMSGDVLSREYTRQAMQSPAKFQEALDVKASWNQEHSDKQKYVLGHGAPWYADPNLKFVKFVWNGKSGEASLTEALFRKSDGTYGATYGWYVRNKLTGEILSDTRVAMSRAERNPQEFQVVPDGGIPLDVAEDYKPRNDRGGTFELFNTRGQNDPY